MEPNATKLVTLTAAVASTGNLSLQVEIEGDFDGLDTPLGNVTFLDVPQNKTTASINGEEVGKVSHNATSNSVLVSGLDQALNGKAWGTGFTLTVQ